VGSAGTVGVSAGGEGSVKVGVAVGVSVGSSTGNEVAVGVLVGISGVSTRGGVKVGDGGGGVKVADGSGVAVGVAVGTMNGSVGVGVATAGDRSGRESRQKRQGWYLHPVRSGNEKSWQPRLNLLRLAYPAR
jgi:hypothetical protein